MYGYNACKIYNIYIYIIVKHVNIIQMQRMYDEWMYNKYSKDRCRESGAHGDR